MTTATMTFVGPADGQPSVTLSHTGETSDAVIPYFFACYREVYGNYYDSIVGKVTQSAEGLDEKGNSIPFSIATDAQIYEAFAQGIAAGVGANVTRYMEDQAVAQAKASVQAATVTQIK